MAKQGLLEFPVDFLKIAHHGSHNGTPGIEILDKILPEDGMSRFAAICTCPGVYGRHEETFVPHKKTIAELARRCTVCSVESLPDGGHLDLSFPADRLGPVALSPDGIGLRAPT